MFTRFVISPFRPTVNPSHNKLVLLFFRRLQTYLLISLFQMKSNFANFLFAVSLLLLNRMRFSCWCGLNIFFAFSPSVPFNKTLVCLGFLCAFQFVLTWFNQNLSFNSDCSFRVTMELKNHLRDGNVLVWNLSWSLNSSGCFFVGFDSCSSAIQYSYALFSPFVGKEAPPS